VVKLHGLGQAAWATKKEERLYILDDGESLNILSPLTSIARLEALARKLL
jgi:hypothetical protein